MLQSFLGGEPLIGIICEETTEKIVALVRAQPGLAPFRKVVCEPGLLFPQLKFKEK